MHTTDATFIGDTSAQGVVQRAVPGSVQGSATERLGMSTSEIEDMGLRLAARVPRDWPDGMVGASGLLRCDRVLGVAFYRGHPRPWRLFSMRKGVVRTRAFLTPEAAMVRGDELAPMRRGRR